MSANGVSWKGCYRLRGWNLPSYWCNLPPCNNFVFIWFAYMITRIFSGLHGLIALISFHQYQNKLNLPIPEWTADTRPRVLSCRPMISSIFMWSCLMTSWIWKWQQSLILMYYLHYSVVGENMQIWAVKMSDSTVLYETVVIPYTIWWAIISYFISYLISSLKTLYTTVSNQHTTYLTLSQKDLSEFSLFPWLIFFFFLLCIRILCYVPET